MRTLEVILPDEPSARRLAGDLVDGLQLPPPEFAPAPPDPCVRVRIQVPVDLLTLVRDVIRIHRGRLVESSAP